MSKCKVYPSLLSADPANLETEIFALEKAGADAIHWDIMDGNFVDAITFGSHIVAALGSKTSLRFDVHLMVENPEKHLESFAEAGADLIIIHQESTKHLHRALSKIRGLGKKAGVALNPATWISHFSHYEDLLDMVLVMSVNPGSSGQKFIASTLQKIEFIRAHLPERIEVCVDGGINPETAKNCLQFGADSLVSGAFIFRDSDYARALKKLKEI